jgi:hypothetical protein
VELVEVQPLLLDDDVELVEVQPLLLDVEVQPLLLDDDVELVEPQPLLLDHTGLSGISNSSHEVEFVHPVIVTVFDTNDILPLAAHHTQSTLLHTALFNTV